ncbi:hypothetical protein K438DRAFT_1782926 [Mycena galopus ATCC 62051]|nr:hypothetical protein K438DRAFT_1782926 [Mycena galopus ATCC 62051]
MEFVEGSSCNKVIINVTVHIEFIEGSSCNKVTINVTVHVEFVEVPQAGIKMYFPAQRNHGSYGTDRLRLGGGISRDDFKDGVLKLTVPDAFTLDGVLLWLSSAEQLSLGGGWQRVFEVESKPRAHYYVEFDSRDTALRIKGLVDANGLIRIASFAEDAEFQGIASGHPAVAVRPAVTNSPLPPSGSSSSIPPRPPSAGGARYHKGIRGDEIRVLDRDRLLQGSHYHEEGVRGAGVGVLRVDGPHPPRAVAAAPFRDDRARSPPQPPTSAIANPGQVPTETLLGRFGLSLEERIRDVRPGNEDSGPRRKRRRPPKAMRRGQGARRECILHGGVEHSTSSSPRLGTHTSALLSRVTGVRSKGYTIPGKSFALAYDIGRALAALPEVSSDEKPPALKHDRFTHSLHDLPMIHGLRAAMSSSSLRVKHITTAASSNVELAFMSKCGWSARRRASLTKTRAPREAG